MSDDDPDKIVVLEEWTSVAAHTRYLDSMGESFEALMELVAERDARPLRGDRLGSPMPKCPVGVEAVEELWFTGVFDVRSQ